MTAWSPIAADLAAAGFDRAHEIGHSGHGAVYRCAQVTTARTVAVKLLTADPDQQSRARFDRERHAMGRLTGQPHIVEVLQAGETAAGRPYLVMPYHRRGSLERRIRTSGRQPVERVLDLGVKLAAALAKVHELGIVHRDVTPAGILFTDADEPALTGFGAAQVAGAFHTATGTIAGSPAFTAPEVLGGDPPTPAADVYGLGATLFCALTGHAAYERRRDEQVIAQFLRIAAEPAPDLRTEGFPDDVCAVIERAMARDPRDRPSAAALSEQLRQIRPAVGSRTPPVRGALPAELTSFVGRRDELAEVGDALRSAHLVTLSGIGGVGKTRLALRAAAEERGVFPDGVVLVRFGHLRDPAAADDMVAAVLGVRDRGRTPLRKLLVDTLSSRAMLLVLDNCEHVVDAVADLAHELLPRCHDLRILATSREPLGVVGEAVVRVPPLAMPSSGGAPSPADLSDVDSVTLFVDRAAAAVPDFTLTDENCTAVAAICARLDGLPLAIELAAARIRALSAEQILERLTDRFALLTHGDRSAPTRQQTLRLSIGWSYGLCTPAEQQLWGRLSLFVGSLELEAAEYVCGDADVVDDLTSLVDKSILIREEDDGRVRFRLLDSVREYGRETIEHAALLPELRRRHRDWYRRLALEAEAQWIGPHQLDWATRLVRELPNLRNAFEFGLTEADDTALVIAAALGPFWLSHGLLGKGRRWLDTALEQTDPRPNPLRAKAVYAYCLLAAIQEDLPAAAVRVRQGRYIVEHLRDPESHAFVDTAEGFTALCGGDIGRAEDCLRRAAAVAEDVGDLRLQIVTTLLLGWICQLRGRTAQALAHHETALSVAESHGESVFRTYALWASGVDLWRMGERDRARTRLEQGLRLTRRTDDPMMVFSCLQALAWIAAQRHRPRRAAVIMGASEAHRDLAGLPEVFFPGLPGHQREFERTVGRKLDAGELEAALREGRAMSTDAAIAYVFAELPVDRPSTPGRRT
ncbi:protein kinase domain-containing protein [Speluncibacter jeojiensis]